MRQAKNDRRSRRTRQLLMQAMVELIRAKPYDHITVQEITDRADVGRSTFYAHFTHKDDLLVDGVHRMLDHLDTAIDTAAPGRLLYPTQALFHHIGAQGELYQTMARGPSLGIFITALQDQLTVLFTDRLAARVPSGATTAVPPALLAAMIAGMLVTAIRTWVENGLNGSAESIDRAFHIAAGPAIRAGLRPTDNGSPAA
ncbi:TetR/AcrR family transcriptional regulator [Actinoplanes sp. NPDC051475]|uniref:TetR/AcrR family transcriptional regulator n=1 Tax=Actinoplanes sp. NPDC051475 TaxID=3157225 RepID=UPI0034502990